MWLNDRRAQLYGGRARLYGERAGLYGRRAWLYDAMILLWLADAQCTALGQIFQLIVINKIISIYKGLVCLCPLKLVSHGSLGNLQST